MRVTLSWMKVKRMQELTGRCLSYELQDCLNMDLTENIKPFLQMIDGSEFYVDQKGFGKIWFEWMHFVV